MHDLGHPSSFWPSADIDSWTSGKLPPLAPERKRFTTSIPIAWVVDVARAPVWLTSEVAKAREVLMSDEAKVEALREVLLAFNQHDLDSIMSHFAGDCVFESPRGPDKWGHRFVGKEEVG